MGKSEQIRQVPKTLSNDIYPSLCTTDHTINSGFIFFDLALDISKSRYSLVIVYDQFQLT
jgi:hypothetical protein